jgi:hypothetical protein
VRLSPDPRPPPRSPRPPHRTAGEIVTVTAAAVGEIRAQALRLTADADRMLSDKSQASASPPHLFHLLPWVRLR